MSVDIFNFGSAELFVLLFLQRGDAHGYELMSKIEESSQGLLSVKSASLYPILYRLEDRGYISSERVFVESTAKNRRGNSARVRVMYHLEPAGRERIEELVTEYRNYFKGGNLILDEYYGGDSDEQ